MTSKPAQAKLFINGEWKDGSTALTYEVLHPQSKKVIVIATSASSEDCNQAVDAAAKAFPIWEATPPSVRRKILLKAADLLESDTYKKRTMEYTCAETGALPFWAAVNAFGAPTVFKEAAVLASQIRGETINSETPGATFIVHRRAIGVVN